MLALPRTLFALLLTVLGGIFVFFHFHGVFFSAASAVQRQVNAAGNTVALGDDNNYAVGLRRHGVPAGLAPLPDISGFTVDKIAAQAPAYSPGKVEVALMQGVPALREFVKKDGRIQRLRLAQRDVNPRAIIVQEGHYDLAHLYEEVKKQTSEPVMVKDGNKYTLRMPLLVAKGASLVISDKDTDELRLSQDQSALIASAGDLYILRTKITGWSEKENKPALFKDKTIYRPYLVDWSGGRLFIAGATVANLGYRKGKAYGISYSSCDPCTLQDPKLPPPTGVIVGSYFTDMYFGFYSYEAEKVAIVGNTYANNVIYGVDPHDRSRGLIIANNEAYGSGKKHGIIVSRNVNDSWIFGNNCHDNHGSGIMIDRTSEHNVIANNIAAHNHGDGITFFESQNNTLFGNQVYKNALSGIRIRNSWNIRLVDDQISDNGSVPVVVYTAKLEDTQKLRNFKEDPYTKRADADVSGTVLKLGDNKPAFKIDGVSHIVLSNVHLLSGGPVFARHMFADESPIVANMDETEEEAVVTNTAPPAKLSQR